MTDKPNAPSQPGGLLSRRSLLVVAGAAGVMTIGGVAWVGTRDPEAFIADLVRASLPTSTLDDATLKVFAGHYMVEFYERFQGGPYDQERLLSMVKIHAADAARNVIGAKPFVEGGMLEDQTVEIVRRALTRYLMNSNYFYVDDPTAELIVYEFKSTACSNPFADLRPSTPEEIIPWLP